MPFFILDLIEGYNFISLIILYLLEQSYYISFSQNQ